jgi:hypothetical protein
MYAGRDECEHYANWTHIPWRMIIDVEALSAELGVNAMERWDMSSRFVSQVLRIDPSDEEKILWIPDFDPREYAFSDELLPPNTTYKNYQSIIPVPSLSRPDKKLIHIGTLFGTTRLRITTPEGRTVLRTVREGTIPNHPLLLGAAQHIAKRLGEGYVGVHLRVGDGVFEESRGENARAIWWSLLRGVFGLDGEVVSKMEEEVETEISGTSPLDGGVKEEPAPLFNISALRIPANELPSLRPLPLDSSSHELCMDPALLPPSLAVSASASPQMNTILSTPIFISTDASSPRSNPLLSRFIRTFPCVFFLEDFLSDPSLNLSLINPHDGVDLAPFLISFLDAFVAASAARVVGTPKSTYSRFVEDVLWRKLDGFRIFVRGGK